MINFEDTIENLEDEIYKKNQLKDDLLQQLDDLRYRQVKIEDEIVSLDTEIENLTKQLEDTKVTDKIIDENNIYQQLGEIDTLKETLNTFAIKYASLVNTTSEYEIGKVYSLADTFKYQNKIYVVLQTHTSMENWKPDLTPSLYVEVKSDSQINGDTQIIKEWVQPLGSHDAYMTGDRVVFDDKVYESLMDNNTYSPKDYPQGWREIIL